MRVGDTTQLDTPAGVAKDAHGDICRLAEGRKVLNVGAAGNARYYRDHGHDGWLHARLNGVASELVGLDLDQEEVNAANALGFAVKLGNCEVADLGQTFDLIILADVLEHVDNPTRALQNLMTHLNPSGKIVITTPNATFFGNVTNALLRRGPNVYWDHVNLYTPENIQALCDRHGWRLSRSAMYSLTDARTTTNTIKSAIIHMAAGLFPRLHAAFLCIIEPID
ncbi:class I SAM-dependent methyltransferase [Magnetovibrio sp. PR-2]|uniref:class I SAM-dependent methyltransferase n=1 Tax=Magnetovibrio sp. PR-2 TaxID=3120356 RepID=UPI002FCDFEA1